MDPEAVAEALALDPEWAQGARGQWLSLMDLAVFGDLKCERIGALARLRKRVLELGERLRSLTGDRAWIPHPREQVKNALASSLNLREALAETRRLAGELGAGAQTETFQLQLRALTLHLEQALAPLERRWAELLDAQYRERDDHE